MLKNQLQKEIQWGGIQEHTWDDDTAIITRKKPRSTHWWIPKDQGQVLLWPRSKGVHMHKIASTESKKVPWTIFNTWSRWLGNSYTAFNHWIWNSSQNPMLVETILWIFKSPTPEESTPPSPNNIIKKSNVTIQCHVVAANMYFRSCLTATCMLHTTYSGESFPASKAYKALCWLKQVNFYSGTEGCFFPEGRYILPYWSGKR